MSWSIKLIGPRKAVFDQLQGPGYSTVPLGIKNAIGEILAAGADSPVNTDFVNQPGAHDSAIVEGHGHAGPENWGGIGELRVELFTAAVSPTPPPSPAPDTHPSSPQST
jgi:hypothetical protein